MTTNAAAIKRIKALVAAGDSQRKVARNTGVCKTTVGNLVNGKTCQPKPRNPNKYVPTRESAYCEVCERMADKNCLVCFLKDKPKGACGKINAGSLDLDLTEEQDARRADAKAEALRILEDEPYEEPIEEEV